MFSFMENLFLKAAIALRAFIKRPIEAPHPSALVQPAQPFLFPMPGICSSLFPCTSPLSFIVWWTQDTRGPSRQTEALILRVLERPSGAVVPRGVRDERSLTSMWAKAFTCMGESFCRSMAMKRNPLFGKYIYGSCLTCSKV